MRNRDRIEKAANSLMLSEQLEAGKELLEGVESKNVYGFFDHSVNLGNVIDHILKENEKKERLVFILASLQKDYRGDHANQSPKVFDYDKRTLSTNFYSIKFLESFCKDRDLDLNIFEVKKKMINLVILTTGKEKTKAVAPPSEDVANTPKPKNNKKVKSNKKKKEKVNNG